ncbi:MAG: uncharacterized protein A8A55_1784 [Amphiamblys sp. WSBS2006]|nr:MAG: uncharacterized protein A8A55_1784 [Amphiamblys sp. WSBS2006]
MVGDEAVEELIERYLSRVLQDASLSRLFTGESFPSLSSSETNRAVCEALQKAAETLLDEIKKEVFRLMDSG